MKIIMPNYMVQELRSKLVDYICNTFPHIPIDYDFDRDKFLKTGRTSCPFCSAYQSFAVNDRGKRQPEFSGHTYKCFTDYAYGGESCELSYMGDLFKLVPIIEGLLHLEGIPPLISTGAYDFAEILFCASVRVGLIDAERIIKEADGRSSLSIDRWHYKHTRYIDITEIDVELKQNEPKKQRISPTKKKSENINVYDSKILEMLGFKGFM